MFQTFDTDPYAHLYGKVDPSDGIPFRSAVPIQPDREGCRGPLRPPAERCVYRVRRRYRVRVRVRGVLYCLGYFESLREARRMRDWFWELAYGTDWRRVTAHGLNRCNAVERAHHQEIIQALDQCSAAKTKPRNAPSV